MSFFKWHKLVVMSNLLVYENERTFPLIMISELATFSSIVPPGLQLQAKALREKNRTKKIINFDIQSI